MIIDDSSDDEPMSAEIMKTLKLMTKTVKIM